MTTGQRLRHVRENILNLKKWRLYVDYKICRSTIYLLEKDTSYPSLATLQLIVSNNCPLQHYIWYILFGSKPIANAIDDLPSFDSVGQRLKYLKNEILKCKTQKEFCNRIQINYDRIDQNLSDRRQPSFDTLNAIANNEILKPYFFWLFFGKSIIQHEVVIKN